MRTLILSAAASVFLSGSAFAHPEMAEKKAPKGVPEATFELPSTAEMEAAIDKMPDLNAIMGDLMNLVKDERLQERMESSGDAFAKKLDKSGAMRLDENGMPDIKLALKALVGALGDEEVTGGLLDTVTELQQVMEKHIPEEDAQTQPE